MKIWRSVWAILKISVSLSVRILKIRLLCVRVCLSKNTDVWLCLCLCLYGSGKPPPPPIKKKKKLSISDFKVGEGSSYSQNICFTAEPKENSQRKAKKIGKTKPKLPKGGRWGRHLGEIPETWPAESCPSGFSTSSLLSGLTRPAQLLTIIGSFLEHHQLHPSGHLDHHQFHGHVPWCYLIIINWSSCWSRSLFVEQCWQGWELPRIEGRSAKRRCSEQESEENHFDGDDEHDDQDDDDDDGQDDDDGDDKPSQRCVGSFPGW